MRVKIKGFKAVDRELVVSRRTVLTAPNGTGKSAIADAIRFLALGYVPALGKTEAATAALMSGTELYVELELPNGNVISRTLERVGDKFRNKVHASWVKGSLAEHEVAVTELFGAEAQDVAEALDIKVLLNETAGRRAARIDAMLGTTSAEDQLQRVARLTIARLLDADEENLPEDHRECYRALPPGRLPILRELAPTIQSHLVDNGMPSCLTWINEAKREAEKGVTHRRSGLTELKSRLGGIRIESDETETELQARRSKLENRIGQIEQIERSEETRRVRLHEATRELATAEKNVADAERELARIRKRAEEMIPAFEAKVEEITDQIAAEKQKARAVPGEAQLAKLDAAIDGIVMEPVEDLSSLRDMIDQREEQLAGMIESPWAEVRAIAGQVKELGTDETAPLADRLAELADENGANNDPERKQLERMRAQFTERNEQRMKVIARNQERTGKLEQLRAERAELSETLAGDRKAYDDWKRKRDAELDRLATMKSTAEEKAKEQLQAVSDQNAHVITLRAKVLTASARVEELSQAPEDLGNIDDLRAEIKRIAGQLGTMSDRAALAREVEAIEKEIDALEATVDVTRAVEWALQRAREEELNRRQGGLLGVVDEFLAGASRKERPYMEVGRGVCDIGWIRDDGRKVPVQAMSGGEYALFATALTAAVIIQHAAPLRVLLVEAAECDRDVMGDLTAGVDRVADRLSYALVMTAHEPECSESWDVVELARPGEAEVAAA